jgi:hypothetical protein
MPLRTAQQPDGPFYFSFRELETRRHSNLIKPLMFNYTRKTAERQCVAEVEGISGS